MRVNPMINGGTGVSTRAFGACLFLGTVQLWAILQRLAYDFGGLEIHDNQLGGTYVNE